MGPPLETERAKVHFCKNVKEAVAHAVLPGVSLEWSQVHMTTVGV